MIAKRCLSASARIERLLYQDILSSLPLPALQCYGVVQDKEAGFHWLFIEDAGTQPYVITSAEHRALSANWLAALHSIRCADSLIEQLPDRGPGHYLSVLRSARAQLDQQLVNPFLKGADISLLETVIGQCDFLEEHWPELDQLCQEAPRVLVHGDLVSKNVRVRPETGGLAFLAFDWEKCGWGVPAEDLAFFPDRTINPDLATYGESVFWQNGVTVQELADCGIIFRLLDSIDWAASCLVLKSYDDWLSRPMASLQVYSTRLDEIFPSWKWKRASSTLSYTAKG